MAFDGRVKFDTSLDKSGLEKGLKDAGGVAKIAAGTIVADIAKATATAVKDVGKAVINIGSDFESAMSSVYAISLATEEEAEKLKQAAIAAGEATKFSATEAGNALEYLSLAGYNANESVEALPKVLNLAAAGGMDLAYTSDLLTDSMAVMGLGIKDMDNYSDQLAMAASKSNTSVAQLGEAVLVAGGQAKLCSMDVAQMNTALGILADKGIKGSEGGTALRNTLKNLYTPTNTAAKELERLGIKTADAEGNLRPMQDVLIDLNAALDGMTEDKKTKAMDKIFDTRTIAAATALLDDCSDRWDELEGYLRNCDGAAEKMAETLQDNLKGRLEQVSSAAESCGLAFYDSISEPLKDAAEEGAVQLSMLAQEMREGELKEGIEELGEGVGSLVNGGIELARDVLPPLLKGSGALCENASVIVPLILGTVGAFKAYSAATTTANTVTALFNSTLMLNPYAMAVAGAVALTGAVVSLTKALTKETETETKNRLEREKLISATNKLKERQEELNGVLYSDASQVEENATAAKELTKNLDSLMKVENKTAIEKEKIADIVEELNELLPEMNLSYDKESDLLKDANGQILDNTDYIYKNIEALKAQALAKVYMDDYIERLKEAKKAEENLVKVTDEFAKASDEWWSYRKNNGASAFDPKWHEIDSHYQELQEAQRVADEAKKAADKAVQDALSEYERVVNSTAEAQSEKAKNNGEEISDNYIEGLVQGAEEGLVYIGGVGYKIGDTLKKSTMLALDEHSPSKDGEDIGAFFDEGMAIGVEKNTSAVVSAAKKMAEEFKNEISEELNDGAVLKENNKKQTEAFEKLLDVLDRKRDAELISEEEYLEEKEKLRDKYLAKGTEEWLDCTQELYEETKKIEEEAIEEEFELLEYRYDKGEITTRQYYDEMAGLRDKYFDEDTEEWKKYTLEILDYQKEACEDLVDAVNDAYEDAFDDVNDKVSDLTNDLKSIGDFYVTGTVEINGEEVGYGSLIDVDKKTEWYEELYNRVTKVKERLKNSGFSDEDIDSFWEHFRNMGEEGMYEYGNLLLAAGNSEFEKHVKGYLEGEEWGKKTADFVYSNDKTDAEEVFANELINILTEAGKKLPDDFFELGDFSGESFAESFLMGVREAIERAEGYVQDFVSSIGGSGALMSNYSAVYNFYASNQTVSAQLRDADAASAMNRARNFS